MKKIIWIIIVLLAAAFVYSSFIAKDREPVVDQSHVVAPVAQTYKATADLTIRDITHPVEFDVLETEDGNFAGTVVVDRTLFDVKFGSGKFFSLEALGDNVVSDFFTLKFDLALAGEKTEGQVALDPALSTLLWEGTRTMVANYRDSGSVALAGGFAAFDAEGALVSGEAVIDMTTIRVLNTGRGGEAETTNMLTGHLSSDDFFNVEMYPTSKVVITSLIPVETGN